MPGQTRVNGTCGSSYCQHPWSMICRLRAVVKMLRYLWAGVAVAAALPGRTFTPIPNFGGAFTSTTEVILGHDGNFYGVAQELSAPQPGGVIFRMTPTGTVASLK